MRILVIEDEIPAQQQLLRLLSKHYPDLVVVGILDSITGSVEWLNKHTQPDIILMDVELSDGKCFELFKMVDIKSNVIITTAYEDYALPAFRAKVMDYLLKPISDDDFVVSMDRCISFCNPDGFNSSVENNNSSEEQVKSYRQRFTIKFGNNIILVDVSNVAYYYSENKATYLVTFDRKKYLMDDSLDTIEELIDPSRFFKISRACIASLRSIDVISKHFNSRLMVSLKPDIIEPVLVSRARVPQLMKWLER